ncbi:hypothetical protein RJ641_017238 [Dillenia turbinata]|uniref:Armadillo repeat-containing domain-containing protein n=1 Tax=Dillenia turbinata TaxID=194707 RepID=A0AAN8UVG9_9MAGN
MPPRTKTTSSSSSSSSSSPSSASSPTQTLLLINNLLSLLLLSILSIKSFIGRWQILHSKLLSLKSSLSELSDSPHWSENLLLQNLLPNLLSTLRRVDCLSSQCSNLSSYNGGKLLMQSDLDIVAATLSKQLNDLELLLKSGVLRQSNAIVLSQPGPGSAKEDLGFYIRDLFTRLQIGGIEFKKKALESLIQLLREDEKAANLVSKEGNVGYLIHLLDLHGQPFVREQAVLAVSMLASASDQSKMVVFEGGGLGPLLRIIESGSSTLKQKAAMAVEAITADHDNAWAVAAYNGVSVLVEVCRSGSQPTVTHAVGAIKNVSMIEDVRFALAEEGAIPILVQLLNSGTVAAQEKAANCIAILTNSGEYFRALILQEKGLLRLLHLFQESSSSDTLEHVLRAIVTLSCSSETVERILSSSTPFILQLCELIKHGNVILQQLSASLISNLSISDGNKRAISSCMAALVKLMENSKPEGLQEVATTALVSLLSVRSNRKEFVRDEKCVMRLMQLLDLKNDLITKRFPLMVVAGILGGGSRGCRRRLLDAGAYEHVQKLVDMEVVGAKKVMQRLAGNRLKSIFSRTWRE